MKALKTTLTTFGSQLWQSAILQNNNNVSHHSINPLMINNLMHQTFLSIPFFPDPVMEDPTAMTHFIVIEKLIQNEASSSALVGRGQNPPMKNITKEITTTLDLLRGKATREVELARSSYGPLRTNSLLLDAVRRSSYVWAAARC